MKTNPLIVEKIKKKYKEMLKDKISEDFFDKEYFGELKIFINKEPLYPLMFLEIESDKIYLGSEKF
jgi:hypothetical protein